jgi:hypothetical protein
MTGIDDDRARLAEWSADNHLAVEYLLDLLRMAEDGIASREREAEKDAEIARLRDEVARWESGQRIKVLPTLPEQPDALHLAAELVRHQTGEYETTDAAMRAAAGALANLDQIARHDRAAVERVRALCDGPDFWDPTDFDRGRMWAYDSIRAALNAGRTDEPT